MLYYVNHGERSEHPRKNKAEHASNIEHAKCIEHAKRPRMHYIVSMQKNTSKQNISRLDSLSSIDFYYRA